MKLFLLSLLIFHAVAHTEMSSCEGKFDCYPHQICAHGTCINLDLYNEMRFAQIPKLIGPKLEKMFEKVEDRKTKAGVVDLAEGLRMMMKRVVAGILFMVLQEGNGTY